ncbi:MAG: bifunctional pyr operon transcriptional regulator/uracil phosphoribosyltransferase, partial [Nitrospirota bacterium]|nr:bifunctional pyr operon transcriptional regulator/uracil phosphoribosyltransferase [Nitrospirota bacterium]
MNISPRPHERPLMDAQEMARALTRISHEILERNKGIEGVAL